MTRSTRPKFVQLEDVRSEIAAGDLLLFRRLGLISLAGRGLHSHAAKVGRWKEDLLCLEVREWVGGRVVTLASQVRRYPGRIDVYETNPDLRWPQYDRAGAVGHMRRLGGCDYGWGNVLAAALVHLPGIRLLARPNTNDRLADRRPPFCSQAVAAAERVGGGVDPVPYLADRLTEPADLARSLFYRYRFTLLP